MHRSHTCGQLNEKNIGETVTLAGWVKSSRNHGWIIFIDLRDRYWITQIVFNPENIDQKIVDLADSLKSEYVIKVVWVVWPRPSGQENEKLSTWKIEVNCNSLEILSKSKDLPFEISEYWNAWEDIRFKYRYLDLRRPVQKDMIIFRSKFNHAARDWFHNHDFVEVQTPIFTVSSPEWARDFLIPSRLNPWKFYALPQAPQQYKQLLMVGWIDKYFQIAPCFRDEDTRLDRHACEFYQIDCEMSFVEQEDIFAVAEGFILDIIKKMAPEKKVLWEKVHRISYNDALDQYGSDKPDIRFWMKLISVNEIFETTNFSVFADTLKNGWIIKAMKAENISMTRKEIDDLTEVAKNAWAKWLAYIIYESEGPKSPILKFFSQQELDSLTQKLEAKTWDMIFFAADEFEKAVWVLNKVRLAIRDKYNLVDKNELGITWVLNFPFYEKDDEWNLDFAHNPFSMPAGWIKAFETDDPTKIMSQQYDMAMNWFEILSWSVRNQDPDVLIKAFEMVWKSEDEVKEKFWAMYNAFQYWAPPHWGFAFGCDRIIMLLTDQENIREIYAFPKSWKAQDVMMWAPWDIDEKQLRELHIKLI